MANICTTEWKIAGTRKAVSDFWEKISQFSPNDTNIYLYHIAEAFGIDYEKKHIHIRGHIYFAEYDEENNVLSFDTESAWNATEDLFDEIGKIYEGEISVSYREMECGCDIFYVRDRGNFFPEECCVDSQGDMFDGNIYEIFATKEDAIKEWCEKMNIERGELSTDQMVDYINEYDYEDDDVFFYIHPFTFE